MCPQRSHGFLPDTLHTEGHRADWLVLRPRLVIAGNGVLALEFLYLPQPCNILLPTTPCVYALSGEVTLGRDDCWAVPPGSGLAQYQGAPMGNASCIRLAVVAELNSFNPFMSFYQGGADGMTLENVVAALATEHQADRFAEMVPALVRGSGYPGVHSSWGDDSCVGNPCSSLSLYPFVRLTALNKRILPGLRVYGTFNFMGIQSETEIVVDVLAPLLFVNVTLAPVSYLGGLIELTRTGAEGEEGLGPNAHVVVQFAERDGISYEDATAVVADYAEHDSVTAAALGVLQDEFAIEVRASLQAHLQIWQFAAAVTFNLSNNALHGSFVASVTDDFAAAVTVDGTFETLDDVAFGVSLVFDGNLLDAIKLLVADAFEDVSTAGAVAVDETMSLAADARAEIEASGVLQDYKASVDGALSSAEALLDDIAALAEDALGTAVAGVLDSARDMVADATAIGSSATARLQALRGQLDNLASRADALEASHSVHDWISLDVYELLAARRSGGGRRHGRQLVDVGALVNIIGANASAVVERTSTGALTTFDMDIVVELLDGAISQVLGSEDMDLNDLAASCTALARVLWDDLLSGNVGAFKGWLAGHSGRGVENLERLADAGASLGQTVAGCGRSCVASLVQDARSGIMTEQLSLNDAEAMLDGFVGQLNGLKRRVQQLLSLGNSIVVEPLADAAGMLEDVAELVIDETQARGASTVATVRSTATSTVQAARQTISRTLAAARSLATATFNTAVATLNGARQTARTTALATLTAVRDQTARLVTAAVARLNAAVDAVENLISGIANGISDIVTGGLSGASEGAACLSDHNCYYRSCDTYCKSCDRVVPCCGRWCRASAAEEHAIDELVSARSARLAAEAQQTVNDANAETAYAAALVDANGTYATGYSNAADTQGTALSTAQQVADAATSAAETTYTASVLAVEQAAAARVTEVEAALAQWAATRGDRNLGYALGRFDVVLSRRRASPQGSVAVRATLAECSTACLADEICTSFDFADTLALRRDPPYSRLASASGRCILNQHVVPPIAVSTPLQTATFRRGSVNVEEYFQYATFRRVYITDIAFALSPFAHFPTLSGVLPSGGQLVAAAACADACAANPDCKHYHWTRTGELGRCALKRAVSSPIRWETQAVGSGAVLGSKTALRECDRRLRSPNACPVEQTCVVVVDAAFVNASKVQNACRWNSCGTVGVLFRQASAPEACVPVSPPCHLRNLVQTATPQPTSDRVCQPISELVDASRCCDGSGCLAGGYLVRQNNSAPQCVTDCPMGLFGNISTHICHSCPSRCALCGEAQSQQCGGCFEPYVLSGGTCLAVCAVTEHAVDGVCRPREPCPAGSFPIFVAGSEMQCNPCPANHACNGSTAPVTCSPSDYTPAQSQPTCTAVPDGQYKIGDATILPCPAGHRCTAGAKWPCLTGSTWQGSPAQATCHPTTPCPATAIQVAAATFMADFVCLSDTVAPVVSGCPAPVVSVTAESGQAGAGVEWVVPTASDDGPGAVAMVATHSPGSTFGLGETVVAYTASDTAGNRNTSCSFTVRVVPTTAPTITCDFVLSSRTAHFSASAVDALQQELAVSFSVTNGSAFPVGSTLVRGAATDRFGNAARCFFRVVVAPAPTSPPTAPPTAPPTSSGTVTSVRNSNSTDGTVGLSGSDAGGAVVSSDAASGSGGGGGPG